MRERLEDIKNGMKSDIQEAWPTWEDIEWLIETVEAQQKELDSWREEFMGV